MLKSGGSSYFYPFKISTTTTHQTACLSELQRNGGSSGSRNENFVVVEELVKFES